jgi:hypothetical protein
MLRASSRLTLVIPSLTDVALLLPALFLFARLNGFASLLGDGDTGWHIRAGEWMLDHRRVPHQDLFSFTQAGRPWFAWEWLSDVAMAWLHRQGGMPAVALAALLVLSATFALLYLLARARSGNVLIAIALTAVAVAVSSLHFLARPHLLTLLFTVLFLMVLESRQLRRLWLLPPLTLVWANLHGGFVFGLGILGAWALGETLGGLLEGRARQRGRPYWLAALACTAATFLNPYLWRLHVHLARYLAPGSWQFAHVDEFLSPSFHHPLAIFFEPALALGMAAAFWHLGRRRFHYVLLLAGSAHLALMSARNLPLYLVVATPVVALALEEWLTAAARAQLPGSMRRLLSGFTRLAARIGSIDRVTRIPVTALLAGAVLTAMLFSPAAAGKCRAEFDGRLFPAGAMAALAAPRARIFTFDQWGDYLIYRLYPNIRVFVDGRSDFYGAEFEQICQNVLNVHHDWEWQLGRYAVDTVLLRAEDPLAGALKETGRWRVTYDDGFAIVFRRAGETVSGGNLVALNPPGNQQIKERTE